MKIFIAKYFAANLKFIKRQAHTKETIFFENTIKRQARRRLGNKLVTAQARQELHYEYTS
jgi:hypothetical protein